MNTKTDNLDKLFPPWMKAIMTIIFTSLIGFGAWTVKSIAANAQEIAVAREAEKNHFAEVEKDTKYIRETIDTINNKLDHMKGR